MPLDPGAKEFPEALAATCPSEVVQLVGMGQRWDSCH